MNEQQILRSPFSIEVHKETFINYLEVIIDEHGTVTYAVPSHQEKLIAAACDKLRLSRGELNDLCPREYYADFITWLCMVSGCVAVWNNFMEGQPNDKQLEAIQELSDAGLYKGRILEGRR